jgi:hypothetical protein
MTKPNENSKIVSQRLLAYMKDNNLSLSALAIKIYGAGPSGQALGIGSLSQLVNGKERIGMVRAQMIRDRIGLDLTDLTAHAARHPRAAIALAAYEDAKKDDLPARREPAQLPRFAVNIGNTGRGSLTLNLMDWPASEILRAINVLVSAGLIDPDAGDRG